MKNPIFLLFSIILLSGSCERESVQKIQINSLISDYNNDDCRVSFNPLAKQDGIQIDVIKEISNNGIVWIYNRFISDSYGWSIEFWINENLEIEKITFEENTDVLIDGVEIKYTVESSIIEFNQSPFDQNYGLFGKYDLFVRQEYVVSKDASEQIKLEFDKATPNRFSFSGKFRMN